jgi:hypothetical protein
LLHLGGDGKRVIALLENWAIADRIFATPVALQLNVRMVASDMD